MKNSSWHAQKRTPFPSAAKLIEIPNYRNTETGIQLLLRLGFQGILEQRPKNSSVTHLSITNLNQMAVDLKASRIRRYLAEGPSFGGQTAGAGGTPRHSYLPSI